MPIRLVELWRRLISMHFRGTRSPRNRRRQRSMASTPCFIWRAIRWRKDGGRRRKKQRIRDSRVLGTRHLVDALRKLKHGRVCWSLPRQLVGTDRAAKRCSTKTRRPAHDFLADVCVAWEQEARTAAEFGIRVVSIRTGMVLGEGGGLSKMLPPFRFGLGGPLGNGKQWVPWIHVDDLAAMYPARGGKHECVRRHERRIAATR